jgi:hypothetical protein
MFAKKTVVMGLCTVSLAFTTAHLMQFGLSLPWLSDRLGNFAQTSEQDVPLYAEMEFRLSQLVSASDVAMGRDPYSRN